MILGPMIAAAMAGALALPVAGTGATASRGTDTTPTTTAAPGAASSPAAASAPASSNPLASLADGLVSLAGAGFAAIGDVGHAVPILGPLATGVAEHVFCAAESIPVAGAVAKASVNKFDKDQSQGDACASATPTGSTASTTSTTSTGGASSGKAPWRHSFKHSSPADSSSLGASPSGSSPMGAPSTGAASTGGSSIGLPMGAPPAGAASTGPAATAPSDHTSPADHTSLTDHASASDHAPASSDHSSALVHMPTSDHAPASDHTSSSDHGPMPGHSATSDHKPASASSASGKVVAQDVTFPKHPFQLRQGSGSNENCLVKGSAGTAAPGPCDASAAWIYQAATGELHPATDSVACLIAPSKDLEMVSVSSCTSALSWARHWYLSGTRRLYVRDADEHDSWRFLGAPGALVVGGVEQRNVPAVPVWSFPAA
jgi:hypothetical protein